MLPYPLLCSSPIMAETGNSALHDVIIGNESQALADESGLPINLDGMTKEETTKLIQTMSKSLTIIRRRNQGLIEAMNSMAENAGTIRANAFEEARQQLEQAALRGKEPQHSGLASPDSQNNLFPDNLPAGTPNRNEAPRKPTDKHHRLPPRAQSIDESEDSGNEEQPPLPPIRRTRSGFDPNDPEDSSSSSSSSSSSGRHADSESEAEVAQVTGRGLFPLPGEAQRKIRWKRLDFSLDKENYLSGISNWDLWYNSLRLALLNIGIPNDQKLKLSKADDNKLAMVITRTTKRQPLELVSGIEEGTKMLKIFRKTYSETGKTRGYGIWKDLQSLRYQGKDPVKHVSTFQKLVRQCKESHMKVNNDQQVSTFIASVEDKASEWTKNTTRRIRNEDLPIASITEDFIAEFRHKIPSSSYERPTDPKRSANPTRGRGGGRGRGGRGGGRGRGSQRTQDTRKPRWDSDGRPLCYNCDEYGHMANKCPKPKRDKGKASSQDTREQGSHAHTNKGTEGPAAQGSAPQGTGFTYCTVGNRKAYEDLVAWYNAQMAQRNEGAEGAATAEAAAEATATPTTAVPTATATKESPGTSTEASTEDLTKAPTSKPVNNTASGPVGDIHSAQPSEVQHPQAPVISQATRNSSASVNIAQIHHQGVEQPNRSLVLWDSGADVYLTNDLQDFLEGTLVDISSQNFRITTGGGPVFATWMGTVIFHFVGPSGQRNWAQVSNVLYVQQFPLKIFSGDLFYRSGGRLKDLTLHNPDGSALTNIDPPRRGFYLWTWGRPEPTLRAD